MWLIAGLLGMIGWVGVIELPPLLRRRHWRTFGLTIVLTLTVAVLGVYQCMFEHTFNPLNWITHGFRLIGIG
ncbi:hypothetical protein IDH44_03240 [Paenibacillus sp. IB182496]|uniref:Uncharacterized protein n=1 Tax=Paenibacillus sabuli TaxID=2772509 RepID=A0A927BQQ7_9BACL|nr:hypothetical protein [Paenibacillus sabuli]MBD2844191.1 hypothetical protein [Paenibacillus sabuli]